MLQWRMLKSLHEKKLQSQRRHLINPNSWINNKTMTIVEYFNRIGLETNIRVPGQNNSNIFIQWYDPIKTQKIYNRTYMYYDFPSKKIKNNTLFPEKCFLIIWFVWKLMFRWGIPFCYCNIPEQKHQPLKWLPYNFFL